MYGGTLLQTGELEGVEAWLRAAERWLDPAEVMEPREDGYEQPGIQAAEMVVDEIEFHRLPGAIAIHRAGQALMLGKVADTLKYARRALDLAPEDDFLRRGGAAVLQGLVLWTIGDLKAARQMYLEGIVYLQRAGYMADSTGAALALADIVIVQGHLREAISIYEQALRFASEHGEPNLRGTADMLVGMSELYLEQNNLQAAIHCLQRSKEQGEHTGLPQNRYRWRVAMARIRAAEGDLNGALDLLHEAERLYASDFSPNVRPVAALKGRIWVVQGRLDEALDWVRAQELSAEDELSYLHEYEHITLARILLAHYKRNRADYVIQETAALLERLLKEAQAGGRAKSEIEILILQALVQHVQGDISAALLPLRRALALAEPKGYLRIFVDEGSPMKQLLREAANQAITPSYTRKLLEAFNDEQPVSQVSSPLPVSQALIEPEVQPAKAFLVESLSQRELEILRLFKTELSGPEIARELVVALSTVRTHTKSIYSKLNVNSRRAAVKRAIELGLI